MSNLAMSPSTYLKDYLWRYLKPTLGEWLSAALLASILGLAIGILLYFTRKGKSKWMQVVYKVLDFLVNTLRSFPFYIMVFFLIPFTKVVMKGLTGYAVFTTEEAFVVPLVVAATPFFSKIFENALIEVKDNVVEAAKSMGLNTWQIITRVILREALPSLVSGITLGMVTLLGYTAMSGSIGAMSLGQFAYDYGWTNYDNQAMLYGVVTILAMVLLTQFLGNIIYKKVK